MAIGEANEPVVILMPSLVISRSVSLIAAFGIGRVALQIFDLAAVDAAALVDHVARDLHGLPVLEAVFGERTGERQQHADPDRLLRVGGQWSAPAAETPRTCATGGEPFMDKLHGSRVQAAEPKA